MIDISLVLIFVVSLLYFSYISLGKIETINNFSVGTRSFSTKALATTIAATWISGSGFVLDVNEFHRQGISFFIQTCAMCLTLSIVGIYIATKMKKHLGKISIASIMGDEYGSKVRYVTAILGLFSACGSVYVQFKVMGMVLHYLFPIPLLFCTAMSATVIIMYSYFGGINSVVFTDKIQAICFSASLIIGIVIFQMTIKDKPPMSPDQYSHFYPSYIATFSLREHFDFWMLFLYFMIPSMSPQVVQRVCMANTVQQSRKSYLLSAVALFIVLSVSCYYSFLLFQVNPDIPKNEALPYLLSLYSIDGTKAILVIGIICMCMSTADSNLNIAAILAGNDLIKPNSTDAIAKLKYARMSTVVIGIASLAFSLKQGSLLDLVLFILSFYMPIITPPFLYALFAKKTSETQCLVAMGTTFLFVLCFKIFIDMNMVIIPIGMLLNLIILWIKPSNWYRWFYG